MLPLENTASRLRDNLFTRSGLTVHCFLQRSGADSGSAEHSARATSFFTLVTASSSKVKHAEQECCVMQGDLSRKEWVAPALSPLTGGTGSAGASGTAAGAGQGLLDSLNNVVEGAKEYLPPQVPHAALASSV